MFVMDFVLTSASFIWLFSTEPDDAVKHPRRESKKQENALFLVEDLPLEKKYGVNVIDSGMLHFPYIPDACVVAL